jgi:hypothetical protein
LEPTAASVHERHADRSARERALEPRLDVVEILLDGAALAVHQITLCDLTNEPGVGRF